MSENADRRGGQAAERRHDEDRSHDERLDRVRQLKAEFANSLNLVKETMTALAKQKK